MATKILTMCTGNICRSPMAEGMLRMGANVVAYKAVIASAGTIEGGRPPDPHAIAAMEDRGIDISRHRSHQLTATDVAAADLILCMAREHVIAAASLVPEAFAKTFTMISFVERATAVGPLGDDLSMSQWLDEVGQGRTHAELLQTGTDDIADPLGQGRRAFDRTADQLEQLCWATIDLLTGYEPRT